MPWAPAGLMMWAASPASRQCPERNRPAVRAWIRKVVLKRSSPMALRPGPRWSSIRWKNSREGGVSSSGCGTLTATRVTSLPSGPRARLPSRV